MAPKSQLWKLNRVQILASHSKGKMLLLRRENEQNLLVEWWGLVPLVASEDSREQGQILWDKGLRFLRRQSDLPFIRIYFIPLSVLIQIKISSECERLWSVRLS